MQKTLIIAFVLITYSIISKSQISSSLPADSKPYGTTTYLSPDGMLWFGTAPLQYRGIYPKTKIDSLLALVLNNGATLNHNIFGNAATATKWGNSQADFNSDGTTFYKVIGFDNGGIAKPYSFTQLGSALGVPSGGINLQTVTLNGNETDQGIRLKTGSEQRFYNAANNNWSVIRSTSNAGSSASDLILSSGAGDVINIMHSGKVGIKTTSPTADLEVNGTGNFSGDLSVNKATGNPLIKLENQSGGSFPLVQFIDNRLGGNNWNIEGGRSIGNLGLYSNYSGTEVLSVAKHGNVGIGITTPSTKLDVNGDISSQSVNGRISLVGGSSSGVNAIYSVNQAQTTYQSLATYATDLTVYNPATGLYGDFSAKAGMFSGNVTAPTFVGNLNGNAATATKWGNSQADFNSDGTTFYKVIGFDNGGIAKPYSVAQLGSALGVPSGGINLQTVTLNGNETDQGIRLKTGSEQRFYNAANNNWSVIRSTSNAGSSASDLILSSGAGDVINIMHSGKVGIKTTSPTADLEVNGTGNFSGDLSVNKATGNPLIKLENQSGGSFPLVQFIDNRLGGNNWNIEGGRSIGNLGLYSNYSGTEVLSVAKHGNVGIGITTPSAKLDVNGDISSQSVNGRISLVGGSSSGVNAIYSVNQAQTTYQSLSTYATDLTVYNPATGLYGDFSAKAGMFSGNVTAPTFVGNLNGNAATATKWGNSQADFNSDGTTFYKVIGFDNGGIAKPYSFAQLGSALGVPSGGINLQTVTLNGNETDRGIRLKTGSEQRFYNAANNNWSVIRSTSNAGSSASDLILSSGAGDVINIMHSGNVGIGTTSPREKLSVNGKIRAQEIKVEASPWPDYVFTKHYHLPTLQETEKHIKEKGHLPGIPSAKEVKTNGIDLGEMNAKLLQKIEELTLHLIEKDKELQKQNTAIKDQRDEIELLKIHLLELTQVVTKMNINTKSK